MKCLLKPALGVGLLLLSGCDVANSARNDLARLTGPTGPFARSQPAPAKSPRTTSTAAKVPASQVPGTNGAAQEPPKQDSPPDTQDTASATLIGKSEGEIRSLLGPPSSEEDRSPGKTWHYQDGQCSMDIQLYPDVQTRQFGTLAYEVKSDDRTDEGKRLCLAQFRSRTQAKGG